MSILGLGLGGTPGPGGSKKPGAGDGKTETRTHQASAQALEKKSFETKAFVAKPVGAGSSLARPQARRPFARMSRRPTTPSTPKSPSSAPASKNAPSPAPSQSRSTTPKPLPLAKLLRRADHLLRNGEVEAWVKLCTDRAQEFGPVEALAAIKDLAKCLSKDLQAKFVNQNQMLVAHLLQVIKKDLNKIPANPLAFFASNCAKLGIKDASLFALISKSAIANIKSYGSAELSFLLTAFAKFELKDKDLCKAIATHMVNSIQTMDPTYFERILGSMAKLGFDSTALFSSVARELLKTGATGMDKTSTLPTMQLTNILHAHASLAMLDRELFRVIVAQLSARLDKTSSKDLAMISYSLAVLLNLYGKSPFGAPRSGIRLLQNLFAELNSRQEELSQEDYSQLNQGMLFLEVLQPEFYNPSNYSTLYQKVQKAMIIKSKTKMRSSVTHRHIHNMLERLIGSKLKMEVFERGYSLDTVLGIYGGKKYLAEIDGPFHFLGSGAAPGKDTLREEILKKLGWKICHIKVTVWQTFLTNEGRAKYLMSCLPLEVRKRVEINLARQQTASPFQQSEIDMSEDEDALIETMGNYFRARSATPSPCSSNRSLAASGGRLSSLSLCSSPASLSSLNRSGSSASLSDLDRSASSISLSDLDRSTSSISLSDLEDLESEPATPVSGTRTLGAGAGAGAGASRSPTPLQASPKMLEAAWNG